jgi:alpha-glucosidase
VMRFWLERGADGFRIDVLWHLIKDADFRDNPRNPDFNRGDPPYRRLLPVHSTDRPEVHDAVAMLRRVIDEYPDRVMIGEVYLPLRQLVTYYGDDLRGAHLPFNFALLETPWQASALAPLITDYETMLPQGAWPNWVLGNHDRPRLASRIGENQARIAAMLLLTLRGTPTIYYGEEIGLKNGVVASDRLRDPIGDSIAGLPAGRDSVRLPMPWDDSRFDGFSTVAPWLPPPDPAEGNVAGQRADRTSLFHLYRRLIALRRATPALLDGRYESIVAKGDLLMLIRSAGDERMLVALNFGEGTIEAIAVQGVIAVSTHGDRDGEILKGWLVLRGHEGVVVRLNN